MEKKDCCENKLTKFVKINFLFFGIICFMILSYKGVEQINWQTASKFVDNSAAEVKAVMKKPKIFVENLGGLTPRDYYPEKKFIWSDTKTKTNYRYRIYGVLPQNFNPEDYLTDNPNDAVELSTRHRTLEIFTNSIDRNYFPELQP